MRYSNADIVPAALRGENASNQNESFSTDHYRPEFTRFGAPYHGCLPHRLTRLLNEAFAAGRISQVIYSYSTPIAWKDGDTWIIPEVTYSATTSSKHQPHLYRLGGKYIPADAGPEEYAQVLAGHTEYRYVTAGSRGRSYIATGR